MTLLLIAALSATGSVLAVHAQQVSTGPVRDSSARQKVTSSLAEMGGSAMSSATTVSMTGQLVLHGSSTSTFPIKIEMRGSTDSRSELTTPNGVRVTIIHGGKGVIQKPDGSSTNLNSNNTATFQTPYLPALALQSEANSSITEIQDLGSSTADGVTTNVIAVGLYQGTTPETSEQLAENTRTIFYIEQATGLVSRIVRLHYSEGADGDPQVEELRYSNYSLINGVMVPVHQETWTNGQLLFEINLASVSFNVAVNDSDFDIAASEQANALN